MIFFVGVFLSTTMTDKTNETRGRTRKEEEEEENLRKTTLVDQWKEILVLIVVASNCGPLNLLVFF